MWAETTLTIGNELWYLVHCQPRKEVFAGNSLQHLLKLRVFLPESQARVHGRIKHIPFFPGYIFISVDLAHISRSQINSCPGVLRLVEFGGTPQEVPDYVIDTIAQQLKRLHLLHTHDFHPGDLVQVKQGPLQDLEMVFVNSTAPGNRVNVLLKLLGRLKAVQINADLLEKVPVQMSVF